MFGERGALERIYPSLVHHAVMSFGSEQVLRFLGHSGRSPVQGEVKTDRRRRVEGVRIKHWVNQNSVKCYDKGSILRVEATINQPKEFRVWRGPENKPEGKKQWRPLRRSVADLHRRAQVSRGTTDRYLTALAAVHVRTALAQQAATVCRPVVRRDRRRYRALNPLGDADAQLLAIVNRGEFALNGFRNRDLRARLYDATEDREQQRRQMTAVGRRLTKVSDNYYSDPRALRAFAVNTDRRFYVAALAVLAMNFRATPLLHQRWPVGLGPSSKMWP